jgi:hypothetical protein
MVMSHDVFATGKYYFGIAVTFNGRSVIRECLASLVDWNGLKLLLRQWLERRNHEYGRTNISWCVMSETSGEFPPAWAGLTRCGIMVLLVGVWV